MTGVKGRSGRTPDPDAARRLRADDPQRWLKWIDLPPEGNTNTPPEMPPPPAWILEEAQWSVRTIAMWNALWHSPQSTMWQADLHPTLERYITLYEMMFVLGNFTGTNISALGQMENDLGLTPKAMHTMYWRVHEPQTEDVKLASVQAMNASKRERITDY